MEAASSSKKRPRKRSRKSKGAKDDGEDVDEQVNNQPEGQTVEDSTSQLPAQSHSEPSSSTSKDPQVEPLATVPGPSNVASSSILTSNPHKPSVLPRPSVYGPRKYTLSVALPSSIVLNAQTMELKTRLVGSVARVCAIFNVDEIVVFNDGSQISNTAAAGNGLGMGQQGGPTARKRQWEEGGSNGFSNGQDSNYSRPDQAEAFDPDSFTAMIFQYLETPQYLRKQLFPMHPNLRLAGLLPPLDLPHHVRFEEESPYREGLVIDEPGYAHKLAIPSPQHPTVWVHVGLKDAVQCKVVGAGDDASLPSVGARVTVKMPEKRVGTLAQLVSPRTPVQTSGLYWGYSVRLATSLSQVFTGCPFTASPTGKKKQKTDPNAAEEYDLVIGTAERGDSLTDVLYATSTGQSIPSSKPSSLHSTIQPLSTSYKHALILFGGLSGLEVTIDQDSQIPLGLEDAHELCDVWIDIAEGQGSRTVRTEEAITIALARLKTVLEQLGRR